jgi:hypothetical protein
VQPCGILSLHTHAKGCRIAGNKGRTRKDSESAPKKRGFESNSLRSTADERFNDSRFGANRNGTI